MENYEFHTNFKALGDKVIAKMVDGFGFKKTAGGIIHREEDASIDAIKSRWFEITHCGPEQKDVRVGEFVLVAHGRWTPGFRIDKLVDEKYYMLDNKEMLAVSDELPKELEK
mgnify:CR=1 FL=1